MTALQHSCGARAGLGRDTAERLKRVSECHRAVQSAPPMGGSKCMIITGILCPVGVLEVGARSFWTMASSCSFSAFLFCAWSCSRLAVF